MNREAERKRLVELIDKAHADYVSFSTEMALAGNYDGVGTFGEFASKRLLDDGWMRPPVKVGDKLYSILPKYFFNVGVVEEKVKGISISIVTDKSIIPIKDLGQTTYVTREDALKAIEGEEDEKNG